MGDLDLKKISEHPTQTIDGVPKFKVPLCVQMSDVRKKKIIHVPVLYANLLEAFCAHWEIFHNTDKTSGAQREAASADFVKLSEGSERGRTVLILADTLFNDHNGAFYDLDEVGHEQMGHGNYKPPVQKNSPWFEFVTLLRELDLNYGIPKEDQAVFLTFSPRQKWKEAISKGHLFPSNSVDGVFFMSHYVGHLPFQDKFQAETLPVLVPLMKNGGKVILGGCQGGTWLWNAPGVRQCFNPGIFYLSSSGESMIFYPPRR